MRILVLCTGNSCRSQMAEAYLRHFLSSGAEVVSAGTHPQGLHPRAVQVMAEDGLDIHRHTSDSVEDYAGQAFDLVFTVCDAAREQCPVFPGGGRRLHESFPDPAKATGSEDEVLEAFRHTRDAIKAYCRELAHSLEAAS